MKKPLLPAAQLLATCFVALVLSVSARADESALGAGAAANYTSGKYGSKTTTSITSLPFFLSYNTDDWTVKLTVPYLIVAGGTGVVPGVGATVNTNPKGRGRHGAGSIAMGLGDITSALSYDAYFNEEARFGVDLTGKVKFGTANRDQGLGTGQNDYTAEVDLFKAFDGLSLLADAAYTSLGSSPYIRLKSGVASGSLGGSYKLSERASLGLSVNASGAVSAASGASRDVTASAGWKLAPQWRLQAYVLKGSGAGGPDFGGGASINGTF